MDGVLDSFIRQRDRTGRVGILDIGSNSVRLVVFDHPRPSALPVFNEKALCGLGRGVTETGNLAVDTMASAVTHIERFAKIAAAMEVDTLDIVATSAVRDAGNAGQFLAEVEQRTGQAVRVLSGVEEGRYAALGVISAFEDVDGIVGDLGGGSLELVSVEHRQVGVSATMPVGPLRLKSLVRGSPRAASFTVDELISSETPWIKELKGRRFYAVGGAWRNIAKAHIIDAKHPIEVVQGYTVKRLELNRFLDRLIDSDGSLPGISKKRLETIPSAALVLRRVLALGMPSEIVFSAFGLREGCVFEDYLRASNSVDPLRLSASEIAERAYRFGAHPETVEAWIEPFFEGLERSDKRLLSALCMLSEMAWSEHPSYRGEHAFLHALRMPVPGIDHRDRVFIALAMLTRYIGHANSKGAGKVSGILIKRRRELALQIGLALRLALTFSGGATELLRRSSVVRDQKGYSIRVPNDLLPLISDVVQRRISALEAALGANIRIGLE